MTAAGGKPNGSKGAEKLAHKTREAVSAFEAGNTTLADRLFKQVASTKDAPPQTAYNYAVFLRRTGSVTQAEYWLGRCLRAAPNHAGARIELALIAMETGAPQAALDQLKGLEADPDALAVKAQAEFKMGQWGHALTTLDSLPKEDNGQALLRLRCLLELNRQDDAEALAADLATAKPALRTDILKALTRRSHGHLPLREAALAARLKP